MYLLLPEMKPNRPLLPVSFGKGESREQRKDPGCLVRVGKRRTIKHKDKKATQCLKRTLIWYH